VVQRVKEEEVPYDGNNVHRPAVVSATRTGRDGAFLFSGVEGGVVRECGGKVRGRVGVLWP
jgi:hypothetical protein